MIEGRWIGPVEESQGEQCHARREMFLLAFCRPSRETSHNLFMGQAQTNPGELLQGTLDMLILKTLSRGAMHGYAIAEFIQQTSGDALRVEEGALYPALHRLELRGLLKSEWGVSENNRRAKYYRLGAAGRKRLTEETEHWSRMTTAIARILEAS
jgi:PadR family transcriptional regulator